jgi:dolichyl-phosphate beta-glucosyltransferase
VPAPWLSVVMPAFDEAVAIAGAVTGARERLDALGRPWELLVVDNASTDGTPERLAPFLADDRIELLRNPVNRGKGYSMRRGMLAARGSLRLHCDVDCVPSFDSLGVLLELIDEGADVAVGSRLAAGRSIGRPQPLRRRIVGRTFVDLCRLALREPTRDLYCGFKLWRGEAAEAAFGAARLDGWVYDAEVLALARAAGADIREAGIVWTDREGSRLSMPRVLVPAVRDLLRARAHVRRVAGARQAAAERVEQPT